MEHVDEDFSGALGDEDSVTLKMGRNNIGTFEIIVGAADANKNVSDTGTITKADGGTYVASYKKDVTDIKFDYFENATAYAFASTWDIENTFENDPSKSLWIRLGSGYNEYTLDVQHYMHLHDTRFIGFIDNNEGFRSMGFFSPASDEQITFRMSGVKLSTTAPKSGRAVTLFMMCIEGALEKLMDFFNLGGFFGENGFYSTVVVDTFNFFFGSDGVLVRSGRTGSILVQRYSSSIINAVIKDDEDE